MSRSRWNRSRTTRTRVAQLLASDGSPVDVAPPRRWRGRHRHSEGVIGLRVVLGGVVVLGTFATPDMPTGQTLSEDGGIGDVEPLGDAFLAERVHGDRRGTDAADVITWRVA